MKHPKLFFGSMVAFIALAIVILFAGCGSGGGELVYGNDVVWDESVTSARCSNSVSLWETCVITMPDTRRVTCAVLRANGGTGVSCDWAHADGADNL